MEKLMNNRTKIDQLLIWMEKNLRAESEFTTKDVSHFFSDEFTIKTNNRIIQATPETYKGYLYELKNTLKHVHYDIEEIFETENKVVASFVIHMYFLNKNPISLSAISIFTFSETKITIWKEIFTDLESTTFQYDPKGNHDS
ncbi:MAG: hypothetical protein BGO10_10955 [Chlamydia sp. 32-24]|nr:MAG: hypothetical protein BGO10_10955 [Chlamydia sp. 32-24]